MRGKLILFFSVALLLGPICEVRSESTPWGVTLFYGKLTKRHFEEIFYTSPSLKRRYLLGGMIRRELAAVREAITWAPERLFLDAEGGLVHKWGSWRGVGDSFWEGVISANLRYDLENNPLYLDSVSFGNGLSLAEKKPNCEKDITLNEQTSPLLYYMMLEAAFRIQRSSPWELVFRAHHRSGIYGAINGVEGGSNYIGCGLRYNFALF